MNSNKDYFLAGVKHETNMQKQALFDTARAQIGAALDGYNSYIGHRNSGLLDENNDIHPIGWMTGSTKPQTPVNKYNPINMWKAYQASKDTIPSQIGRFAQKNWKPIVGTGAALGGVALLSSLFSKKKKEQGPNININIGGQSGRNFGPRALPDMYEKTGGVNVIQPLMNHGLNAAIDYAISSHLPTEEPTAQPNSYEPEISSQNVELEKMIEKDPRVREYIKKLILDSESKIK